MRKHALSWKVPRSLCTAEWATKKSRTCGPPWWHRWLGPPGVPGERPVADLLSVRDGRSILRSKMESRSTFEVRWAKVREPPSSSWFSALTTPASLTKAEQAFWQRPAKTLSSKTLWSFESRHMPAPGLKPPAWGICWQLPILKRFRVRSQILGTTLP